MERWVTGSDPADENTFPDKMSRILLESKWAYRAAQRAHGIKFPEDPSGEMVQDLIRMATEGCAVKDIIEEARRRGRPLEAPEDD